MRKKALALQLPKAPMSRTVAALRLRTISDQNVIPHRAHQGCFLLAKGNAEKNARVNQEMEYDRLLGASLHPGLGSYAIARLDDLKTLLNKRG